MTKQQKKQPIKGANILFYVILMIIVLGMVSLFMRTPDTSDHPTVNEFRTHLNSGTIKNITTKPLTGNNIGMLVVSGEYNVAVNDTTEYSLNVTAVAFDELYIIIVAEDIEYTADTTSNNNTLGIILSILPIVLIVGLFIFIMKNSNSGNNKAFDFAKNRARLNHEKTVSFKDVAGCDEEKEELEEIIDFLKDPRKYIEIGARIPSGILLFGAPGTGKTLLAKAVAGEANVPFYSIAGSDFVEMFVGVGASRVRDLFKVAKENKPCIVFIDEIDAVGRQRGTGLGGGHDEREQTLNQLLVEMDGFGNNSGIIIIAATNRPDVLDPALLRPGRFDRQITVAVPDVIGREAILKVHSRNKLFAKNVKFMEIAQRIPGFTGAEIENLLNEAALLAARANRKVIEIYDIDEAVDRVLMGPAKKSRKYSIKERELVSYHEAGHAVIGIKLENASIVQKVTIIPRGAAGGYSLMLPEKETFLETKQSLLDTITGLLGGRVSEDVVFNIMTTGAHNDFQKASKIARAMVTEYGMSDLGPVQYENSGGKVFLGRDYFNEKNFSDQVAHEIDKAVREIITTCYNKAKKVLNDNIDLLHSIAHYLLEVETLNKTDIYEIAESGKLDWWEKRKESIESEEAEDSKEEKTEDLKEE